MSAALPKPRARKARSRVQARTGDARQRVLSSLRHPRSQLFFEHVPDPRFDVVELRREPHLVIARPGQLNFQSLFSPAGPRRHDDDAIREISRLLYAVSDKPVSYTHLRAHETPEHL